MLPAVVAAEPVAELEAEAAVRSEDIAEERHTVAEGVECGRRFWRHSNRSSCEEEERLEDVAAGLEEPRIEVVAAGPVAVELVVPHIAAVVELAVGHIVGPPVMVRIVAVVVVDIVAAVEEAKGRKEWTIWAVA